VVVTAPRLNVQVRTRLALATLVLAVLGWRSVEVDVRTNAVELREAGDKDCMLLHSLNKYAVLQRGVSDFESKYEH